MSWLLRNFQERRVMWQRTGSARTSRRKSHSALVLFSGKILVGFMTVLGCVAMLSSTVLADGRDCKTAGIVVDAGSPIDFEMACDGARDAILFLEQQGVAATATLHLKTVDALPKPAAPSAAGIYVPDQNQIYLLSYAELEKRGPLFQLPLSRRLYRSLATHESAHAIAGTLFRQPHPRLEAQEYIAYVAMLTMMDSEDRALILQKFTGFGFTTESHINTFTYLVEPLQFGVFAYRHYLRPEVGANFIRRIIAGEALSGTKAY